jgi:outer membrane protein
MASIRRVLTHVTVLSAAFTTATLTSASPLSPVVTSDPLCDGGVCKIRLTPRQLLDAASRLVTERRFSEASPLIDALQNVPEYNLERHFLAGYVAAETGDLDTAIDHFRMALAKDPKQTRVRLELARAMMLKGKDGAADYNFRLAQQDGDLPPEVLATVRASRGILRDRRPWHFTFQFGFAPDTNINGATSAKTVDVTLGDLTIPLELDPNARARSGLGQTASLSAGYRFGLNEKTFLLVDGDAQGVNYTGESNDDYTGQIAIGPQFRLGETTELSVQALGLERLYGGKRAMTQVGGKLGFQHVLEQGQRVGLSLDARHTASGFGNDYSGWQLGAYATYERIVARSMIASVSLFARTDRLNAKAYSNREIGASIGLGGELPLGINGGVTATASRANYEAAIAVLSPNPRADWRLSGRAYAGLRSLRVFGFSPSVSYTYTRNASSVTLYDSKRSRFAFDLARYF